MESIAPAAVYSEIKSARSWSIIGSYWRTSAAKKISSQKTLGFMENMHVALNSGSPLLTATTFENPFFTMEARS